MGWTTYDGLAFAPSLRVHARAGAELVGVRSRSTTVPGTVAEWQEWAQMRFSETGGYAVAGALTPSRSASRGTTAPDRPFPEAP